MKMNMTNYTTSHIDTR